jgi:hypothetical protein
VTFTVTTLLQRQSDVEECGHLFSYGLVFLLNVLGVGLWVVLISAVSLEQMILILAGHVGSNTALAANGVARLARELYNKGWRCPL